MKKTTITFNCLWLILGSLALNAEPQRSHEDIGGYFGVGAGPALQENLTFRGPGIMGSPKISFSTGARVDMAIGARNQYCGFEFQTGTIYNRIKRISDASLNDSNLTFELYQIPFMINGYYYLPFKGPVTGYVGGGIGAVVSNFRVNASFIYDNYYETTFGYQGMAGLNWKLTERLDFDLGYKFLGTTDHDLGQGYKTDGTRNHSILASVRFKF